MPQCPLSAILKDISMLLCLSVKTPPASLYSRKYFVPWTSCSIHAIKLSSRPDLSYNQYKCQMRIWQNTHYYPHFHWALLSSLIWTSESIPLPCLASASANAKGGLGWGGQEPVPESRITKLACFNLEKTPKDLISWFIETYQQVGSVLVVSHTN